MSELVDFRLLRLVPLAALLFSARAFAQFEVAPDHFDSKPKTERRLRSRPKARPGLT